MSKRASPFDQLCADRLADEVAVLVRRGVIDSRSPAADALLDYRNPPSTPRADRLAELEGRAAITMPAPTFREICERNGQDPDELLGEGQMVAGRLVTGPVPFSFASGPRLLDRALAAARVLETMLRTADLPRGREVAAELVADLEKALGVS